MDKYYALFEDENQKYSVFTRAPPQGFSEAPNSAGMKRVMNPK
jgi:hypothetical protein